MNHEELVHQLAMIKVKLTYSEQSVIDEAIERLDSIKDLNLFSIRLKAARKKKQWSLVELGKRTNISKSKLSLYERGQGNAPLLSHVKILADELGVDQGSSYHKSPQAGGKCQG